MAFNPNDHLIDLKGKSYLQVMWRLVWFREDHPLWTIKTTLHQLDMEKAHAVFVAEIYDEKQNLLSTGYGSESARDFKDFIEKAETKAVGRALAMLGYGTQFAPELEEGERIVDSPAAKKKAQASKKQAPAAKEDKAQKDPPPMVCCECGIEISRDQANKTWKKYNHKLYCANCEAKIAPLTE